MKRRNKRRYLFLLSILIFLTIGFLWIKSHYVVPVIMYHAIDYNAEASKLSVTPESFERQMTFLKKNNYNVVRFEDLASMIPKGRIPHKTIAITFDDGYENNYTYAYPVLKKYNLPATIFVIPGLVGKENYADWGKITEMSESGIITIGSHTMNHKYLKGLPIQVLQDEIYGSKRAIESHIQKEVNSFCYPLGGFDERARDTVREAGYKIAAATNPGRKYPKYDLFAMKRLRISRTSDNLFVFFIETSGFYTLIKEYRDED